MKRTPFKKRTALIQRKPWTPKRTALKTKKVSMSRKGSVMSKALRADVGADPEYSRCALQGLLSEIIGPCAGRVTREHAMYFKGSKIQKKWAIPPICACHHGVDEYQDGPGEAPKIVRQWVALNRATDEELREVSKAVNYINERDRLNKIYGEYTPPPIPKSSEIMY